MDKEHLIPDGRVIPVPEERRVSTDVICTIIGAIFALVFFILACIFYSSCNSPLTQQASTRPTLTSINTNTLMRETKHR